MLRFLWKCVLEVLPPTCATVIAGVLLSAYHEHGLPLQNIVDPRPSVEQAAAAADGAKGRQAVVAPQVRSEHAADPVAIDGQSSAPGPDANASAPGGEGSTADGKTGETKTSDVAENKSPEANTTDAQAAQLNAVLMASSPMSQPPAEIKAAQPVETKDPDDHPAAEDLPVVDLPVGPSAPAEAVQPTEAGPPAGKPTAAPPSDAQASPPVPRPRFSGRIAKPAHKATSFKAEAERLPPPLVAMVPLPPPAVPPMVAMEAAPPVASNRSTPRSPPRAQAPPPQVMGSTPPQMVALTPPQVISPRPSEAIGLTPPAIVPNVGVVGAAGPTGAQSSPGAPQGGVNSDQEGVAKPPEPKRVFGVPVPQTIVAVGDALDPRPVISAGQRAFDKLVTTAKSVVPDFGHEQ